MKLTPLERLAAQLLSLYWTGAGDAGYDRVIYQFHEWLDKADKDETILRQILEDGKGSTIVHNGIEMTQTEYFTMLANKIMV